MFKTPLVTPLVRRHKFNLCGTFDGWPKVVVRGRKAEGLRKGVRKQWNMGSLYEVRGRMAEGLRKVARKQKTSLCIYNITE